MDREDEISGINISGVDLGSNLKRIEVDFDVRQDSRARFKSKGVATRKILVGKPIAGKTFELCGVVKLFSELGFRDFLLSLPKNCYHSLVRELYARLHVNSVGQYVSFVQYVKVTLSPMFLNVILNINNPSTVSIHNKKDPKDLEGFSTLDQLKLITAQTD